MDDVFSGNTVLSANETAARHKAMNDTKIFFIVILGKLIKLFWSVFFYGNLHDPMKVSSWAIEGIFVGT